MTSANKATVQGTPDSGNASSSPGPNASRPADAVSPEANVARDPQTGQALRDSSLGSGDPQDLSDGGARSSRHTGDAAKH